ncbi:MAG: hypothetical protein HOP09_14785 [Hyphomicrobium sp.]|nr:hypothetical protein [Hyphomicrobium sp.]
MKPVIFLDFDGVIIIAASYDRAGGLGRQHWLAGTPPIGLGHLIEPALVKNVQALATEMGGAEVVLSTGWRDERCMDGYRFVLEANGLDAEVVGETPSLRPRKMSAIVKRSDEISAWLKSNRPADFGKFIVLEDEENVRALEPRVVYTRFGTGFDDERLRAAVELWGSINKQES